MSNPKPSGAWFRKQRKERERCEKLEAAACRTAAGEPLPHAARYAGLGGAPVDSTKSPVWMLGVVTATVAEALESPVLDDAARRRFVIEAGRTIAQLATKAVYAARITRLEGMVYGRRGVPAADTTPADDGLEDISEDA